MINYASFLVAYMRGQIDGQTPDKDIFNRRLNPDNPKNTFELIPSDFTK
jgi:hypothetical protein